MQGGRDPFFGGGPFGSIGDPFRSMGDPFSSIGDPFGSFGGFGGQRSLISSFFGGRDPFDDPFFRRPFESTFESNFFGSNGGPFMNPHTSGLLQHQPSQPNLSRGPVIEELTSDDEKDEKEPNVSRGPVIEELTSDDEKDEKENGKEKKENPRKHGRSSKEPVVEDPDDEVTEKRSKYMPQRNDMNQMQHVRSHPQMQSFTFQSSSVSYGGANGAYYSTSSTRRTGSDGLTFEEFKEADSSARRATHRVSRGIHDKGHSVTRKLKSDGHVDTMQALHNLNEDELVGFNEAWKGNARRHHLPGWNGEFANRNVIGSGSVGNRGALALPSAERPNNPYAAPPQHSRVRSDRSGSTSQGNRRR